MNLFYEKNTPTPNTNNQPRPCRSDRIQPIRQPTAGGGLSIVNSDLALSAMSEQQHRRFQCDHRHRYAQQNLGVAQTGQKQGRGGRIYGRTVWQLCYLRSANDTCHHLLMGAASGVGIGWFRADFTPP